MNGRVNVFDGFGESVERYVFRVLGVDKCMFVGDEIENFSGISMENLV